MLNARHFIVSALALATLGAALTACGQRGPLYLPTDPIAKDRATLPGLLLPTQPAPATPPAPATQPGAIATPVPDRAPANSAPAGATR